MSSPLYYCVSGIVISLLFCVVMQIYALDGDNSCTSNFDVYMVKDDGETGEKITDTPEYAGICLKELNSDDTKDFAGSFNRSLEIADFFKGDLGIAKPAKILLDPLQSLFKTTGGTQYLVPGLKIWWDSPAPELSRQHLKGFLFKYGEEKCRLIQFNQTKMNLIPKLRFSYNLDRVQANKSLNVEVYSVPTPQTKPNIDDFVHGTVKTSPFIKYGSSSSTWCPSISLHVLPNGRLDVGITRSPLVYNFTQFDLRLMKKSVSESNSFFDKTLDVEVASASDSSYHYMIEDLEPDQYQVTIKALDQFRMIDGKCQCWRTFETTPNTRNCENNCFACRTNWVNVTNGYTGGENGQKISTETPSRATTAHTVTTEKQQSTSVKSPSVGKSRLSNEDSSNGTLIIALMVVAVLVAVLVGTLIFVLTRKTYKRRQAGLAEKKKAIPQQITGVIAPVKDFDNSKHGVLGPASLSTKTVYLLYSQDHEAHLHLVDCLAEFLQVHCNCQVIYRRWSDVGPEQGGLAWVVSNISSSDLVLFVASQGAEKFVEAQLYKKVYRARQLGPEGDLFQLGVQRLLSDGVSDHVVPVHFGDTKWCKKYLLFPMMYKLPSHMPDMLQHVHKLSPSEIKAYNMNLPLSVETLSELPEGAKLLEAISAANKYEVNNPNWFEDNFGVSTPTMITLTSNSTVTDSDYGSMGPTMSVSSQDINTSDYVGSPVSVFDDPDFSPYLYREGSTRSNPEHCLSIHQCNIQNPLGGGSQRLVNQSKKYLPSIYTITTGLAEATRPPDVIQTTDRICPPETMSDVGTEVMSTALHNINLQTEWATPPSQSNQYDTKQFTCIPPTDICNIKPPQLCSDVSSDCLSMAFQQVNKGSEQAFSQQAPSFLLKDVREEDDDHPDFPNSDAISV